MRRLEENKGLRFQAERPCASSPAYQPSVSGTHHRVFFRILQHLLIQMNQRCDGKLENRAVLVQAWVQERGERARKDKLGWSWRHCLPSAFSSHVELERVGGSRSRASGHPQTPRTAKGCTPERGAASQPGLPASILFEFPLNVAVEKPLSIFMVNWRRPI